MMKNVMILSVLAVLFIVSGSSQAVDKKVYSIADGCSDPYRNYPNGSSYSMWTDGSSMYANSRRRAVMKFDTTIVTNHTLRGTVLNIWGSSGNSENSLVDIYHYGNDTWSESSIPYASSLGNKLASVSVSRASDISICNKYEVHLNNMPYVSPNDNTLSLALVASGTHGSYFVTRNGVNWNNTLNKKPYITFRAWGDDSIESGQFDEYFGNFAINSGGGTAQIISNPYGDGGVAQLTTASPIGITQILDTPQDPFYIVFDYEFLTDTGILDVTLTDRNGVELIVGQLTAPASLVGRMSFAAFRVDDPNWLFLDNVTLGIELDGPTGSQILLDNMEFSNAPEPTTLTLLTLTGLAVLRKRRMQ